MNTNIGVMLSFIMALLHLALAGINANDNVILISQLTAVIFWLFHAKLAAEGI